MRRLIPALLAGLVLLTLAPGVADASIRTKIIKDCADDGELQGTYTKSQLRDARQNLGADTAEYTDCVDVLRRAENRLNQSNNPTTPPATSGTGAAPGTPAPGAASAAGDDGGDTVAPETDVDREALKAAEAQGAQPVTVGDQNISPSTTAIKAAAPTNSLPGSVLLVVILLVLGAAAVLGPAVRKRFPGPWNRG